MRRSAATELSRRTNSAIAGLSETVRSTATPVAIREKIRTRLVRGWSMRTAGLCVWVSDDDTVTEKSVI